jgi:hypothetical protein
MFGTTFFDDYIKAGSRFSAAETLAELANSPHHRIRLRVAENERSPARVLEALAQDRDADIRAAVASNPSTPVDTVFTLSLDADPTVRHSMAEDPHIPLGVLRRLAKDENAYVSCRARKTLALLTKDNRDAIDGCNIYVWNHPSCGQLA